jgi:hypothetical protein
MAERLAERAEQMVQAMAQNELGLSEHRFPNPWKSSASAAISTAIGAFIPIIPFFFMSGIAAVIAAFAVSIVAHFYRRSVEVAHYDSLVVGVGIGNDDRRRDRGGSHLQPRSCPLARSVNRFLPLEPESEKVAQGVFFGGTSNFSGIPVFGLMLAAIDVCLLAG